MLQRRKQHTVEVYKVVKKRRTNVGKRGYEKSSRNTLNEIMLRSFILILGKKGINAYL